MSLRPLIRLIVAAALVAACAAPTPSPPAEPTRTPVQASPNPGLVELEGRMAAAATELGSIVRELGEASAGSPRELELVAGQLGSFAADELAWVDDHAPDGCYEAVTASFREALASVQASAAEFEDVAGASPPPGDEAFEGAGAALAAGSQGIEAARAAALEARAACR